MPESPADCRNSCASQPIYLCFRANLSREIWLVETKPPSIGPSLGRSQVHSRRDNWSSKDEVERTAFGHIAGVNRLTTNSVSYPVRRPLGSSSRGGQGARGRNDRAICPEATGSLDVDGLVRAGRISDAIALAHSAVFLGDQCPEAVGRMRLTLSSLLFMSDRLHESMTQANAILAEPGLSGTVHAGAQLVQLRGLLMAGRSEAARLGAESILAGGHRGAGDMALSGAFCTLGYLAWDEGRATEALRWMHAAIQRADQGPSEVRRGYPRLHMVCMLTSLGEFELAAELLLDAEEQVDVLHHTEWRAAVPAVRARLLLARGESEEAETEAQRAIDLCDQMGTPVFAPMALGVLATVASRRGHVARAAHLLGDARATPPPVGVLGWASHTWARIQLERAQVGRPQALELLSSYVSDDVAVNRLLLEEPAGAAWWVRAALADGDRVTAERIVSSIEVIARSNPEVSILTAASMHARGAFDKRPDILRDASALYRSPWARASATEDTGTTLALSDWSASLIEFERALSVYSQIGAVLDASRVRRRRRQKAERPVSGWASLTATERRVALVVAEGLTNPQVGNRLFLSRHTVDFHLRQVFRKLGITSRVELVRLVITDGRTLAPTQ